MAAQVGLSTVNSANAMLNAFRNTAHQVAATYVKIHTGIPGADGTANAAAGDTARPAVTFSAASNGALAITGSPPEWTNAGNTNETVTHCSVWDSNTAGNFLWSFQLTASKTWTTTGDTLTLTACNLSLAPLAASA